MKTYLVTFTLCIGLLLSSCGGAATEAPVAEEPKDVVIFVVDDFSQSSYPDKSAVDVKENCIVTPDGQKYGATGTGLTEYPVDINGNPIYHGDAVYNDLIAQISGFTEVLPDQIIDDQNHQWLKRISIWESRQSNLTVAGVDTIGYTTSILRDNLESALSLFEGGGSIVLGDGTTHSIEPTRYLVVNMSFAIVPCKDLKLEDYQSLEELDELYTALNAFAQDPDKQQDDPLYQLIHNKSDSPGRVFVASSGNKGQYFAYPFAPAIWNFVISVSASSDQEREEFSLDPVNCPRKGITDYSNCGEIKMDGETRGDKGTSYASPKFSYEIARFLMDDKISQCSNSVLDIFGYAGEYGIWNNLSFDDAFNLNCQPSSGSMGGTPVTIRWFVGLGTGTNPEQVAVQEEVVADFNASHDKIELVLEIVPYDAARDTLSTQIASGAGPDIVGPVGWGGSNDFYGQWLDLTPYIQSSGFDTSIFDPALVKFYQTEEGQVGLPFAVFPGAMYYIPAMFDEAGLNYPPQVYGEKYVFPNGYEADWNWETITEVARLLTLDIYGNSSTEYGFDRTQIVQVGYTPQWQSLLSIGTFYGGAAKIFTVDSAGYYQPTIPDSWREAWKWYYDGMWGAQPFIATGPLSGAPEFGNGNLFNTGKAAMGLTQTWYTCCLGDFKNAGLEFQLGIQPIGANGQVAGRVDADTFRILKSSNNPEAAFEVLAYLITTGGDKLLPTYGAMPAIASKTDAFLAQKSNDYPFVTQESWNVFIQGLSYPDAPSSEQYQPNSIKANARFSTFLDLINNTEGLDFDAEFQKLIDDLYVIYNE